MSSFVEKDVEISNAETEKVEQFLRTENPLEKLVLKKSTKWEGFDELVKKIKEGVKSQHGGREVVVDVQLKGSDEVTVYQVRNQYFAKGD